MSSTRTRQLTHATQRQARSNARSLAYLLRLSRSHKRRDVAIAVEGLTNHSNPRAVQRLAGMLHHDDVVLAAQAAEALATRKDGKGIPALERVVRHSRDGVSRFNAIKGLGQSTSRHAYRVMRYAANTAEVERSIVIAALKRHQTASAVSILEAIAREPLHDLDRWNVVHALRKNQHPSAYHALALMAKRFEGNEQRAAMGALFHEPPVPGRIPTLLRLASERGIQRETRLDFNRKTRFQVRLEAIQALNAHHAVLYGKPGALQNDTLTRLHWLLPHLSHTTNAAIQEPIENDAHGHRLSVITENPEIVAAVLHALFHPNPLRRLKTPKDTKLYLTQLRNAHARDQLK